jgi:hypothetical protein
MGMGFQTVCTTVVVVHSLVSPKRIVKLGNISVIAQAQRFPLKTMNKQMELAGGVSPVGIHSGAISVAI